MDDRRPNPDALLARLQAEAASRTRGRLKVFFGATAGVGKTYALLEAARQRRAEGVDVVAGWVETHGRSETERLLEGLLALPPRLIPYRGTTQREFDLDAALARHPALLLVDELAHTNVPGARHAKRWQDVEELLGAGIDVYTTVNVQHLESLNDLVAQITGVRVRETVPDRLVERADEVELVDLSPDDLRQRLNDGKVYVPQQAQAAVQNFFRKGNLIALRELALRVTAARVDVQMQAYMREHAIDRTWPAVERIMVCIGADPRAPRLLRAARRMAAPLRAEWLVVNIERADALPASAAGREQVAQTLRLAERLGAETITLAGQNVGQEIVRLARLRNVSRIVMGKPLRPRWQELLAGSLTNYVVRHSGEIEVDLIATGEEAPPAAAFPAPQAMVASARRRWPAYVWSAVAVGLCTALAALMLNHFTLANLIMVYLVGIMLVALRFGRGPSLLAACLSVASYDFFFVPPYYTFAVSDTEHVPTFGVMFLVAVVIGTLTARVRQEAEAARERGLRTAALYALSRELARARYREQIVEAVAQQVTEVFDSRAALLLPDGVRHLAPAGTPGFPIDANEAGVAQWVFEHGERAGKGSDTLPGAQALYLPLVTAHNVLGVLGVRPARPEGLLAHEQLHLLETFANQAAVALERVRLVDEAQRARVQVETEQLRNTLLSSISHDLRTPLASITGAISSLLESEGRLDGPVHHELLRTAYEEAERLTRLMRNLLDMTRLESGAARVRKEWQPLEEVVGAALSRLEGPLRDRPVTTHLPATLPLVPLDGVLIEQTLVNLLENAIKYTPEDSPIEVVAEQGDQEVAITVADRGPGLPAGDEERVFEKFYRAQPEGAQPGAGLGLSICRAIVSAHGGRISAANRPGGGALFSFSLPLGAEPPALRAEPAAPSNRTGEPTGEPRG